MVKLNVNGVEVGNDELVFLPERGILPEVENTLTQVGGNDGSVFLRNRLKERTIPIKFVVKTMNRRDFEIAMSTILHSKEPVPLIFSDKPNEVWYGVVDGEIDLDRAYNIGKGSIKWLVPDGHAHAKQTKTATNNGGKTIEFVNDGTDETPVKVTADMVTQNGFLGLTLNGRYYQIGNPTEVDGVQLPPSEMIVPDGLAAFSKGQINNKAYQPLPPLMGRLSQTGTVAKTTHGIEATAYGDSAEKSWAGPSITWTFPATEDGKIGARSFFLWQDADFETWQKTEAGFQVHTVQDKDGKRLFSVILMDQSGTVNQSKIIVFVNDKKVYEANNNWTGVGYRGYMSMTKAGNNFVVVYGKTTKTFVDTALTDSEGYFYTVGFGKWFNNPAPKNNWVSQWKLREDKIDSWIDIPNFFNIGDKVVLDSNSNTLIINEVPNWDRVDIGSKPLIANVGDNELGIVVSDFATMPKVTVEYRERWL